jgi:hypothetical protein
MEEGFHKDDDDASIRSEEREGEEREGEREETEDQDGQQNSVDSSVPCHDEDAAFDDCENLGEFSSQI